MLYKNCAELILIDIWPIMDIETESAIVLAITEEQKINIVMNQSDVFLSGEKFESCLAVRGVSC